ncbi:MAG: PAS domain-containing protein, partial [Thermomicrobia bacterium]|nr:PAS domain-containing protein [Thermomicrobia bacterium]
TVIIQNPATASFPSMPLSLAPSTVDIVTDIENIGPILADLVKGVPVPARLAQERALGTLLDQLRMRSGIDFSNYKAATIMRRLQRRMIANGSARLPDYIRFLQANPDEYQRLVSSFLIKVTEFFRDADLFALLREQILPELIAEARKHNNELRLWSAGCATGEEAYSLAMLLSDLLGNELPQFNIRIFATDLDNDAITFARRGIYSAAALANLPREMIERHFIQLGDEYEIRKPVRALTVFGQHDLGQRAPFPRIDLELCRNVLIYFTPELQRRALQLFTFSVRDGGFLILGKSETTNPLSEHFFLEHPHLKVYRRQGERMLFPPARYADVASMVPKMRIAGTPRIVEVGQSRIQLAVQQSRASREQSESLLLGLPFGVVVVDRRYDIQFINSVARRLFGIHNAAIGEDFLHCVQTAPTVPLRAAIDAALQGEQEVVPQEERVTDVVTGEIRHLVVACYPQTFSTNDGLVDAVLVTVQDITDRARERHALEEAYALARAESERVTALMNRLAEANRRLLEANQELSTSNVALRSANEEFLVSSEEAQAATEEIETLNEELQATNEELETLNEELQSTVEELNTTNEDLQARAIELQDAAVSLEAQRRSSEAERERLAAILGGIGDAVLVVDRTGTTILANDRFEEFFSAGEDGFVPEDETGQPMPLDQTPQQRAARGESFATSFTITAPDGSRRWYEATGRPISSDGQQGGVLSIRDITERSLRRLQDEFLAVASHELRTPLTGLSGYLQLLVRFFDAEGADERPRRYVTRALEQAQRLMSLINELMDVARLQRGRLTLVQAPVDLAPIVRHATETAGMLTQTQTITLEAGDDSLMIAGDDRRLEQVILNLLTNAISHAPDSPRIDVRLRRADGQAEVEVEDYGPGIATAELANIFSRFYRVEQAGQSPGNDGLGLGLYIAREIVVAHGGTVAVRSTPGKGTTFTVRLPIGEGARTED